MTLIPHITRETNAEPDAAVIWLHGLGANGEDFEAIVPELSLPADASIRFIFPHAPMIPVTINNGYVMPAWYDILDMSIDRKVDEKQLRESALAITALIEQQVRLGIPYHRIILAGFSQGGAVAIETALSFPEKLGGLLAMSTYFATKNSIHLSVPNQKLPVAVQHGDFDPVVPVTLGESTFDLLVSKDYPVTFTRYPMEHAVCPQQIEDISLWFIKVLAL